MYQIQPSGPEHRRLPKAQPQVPRKPPRGCSSRRRGLEMTAIPATRRPVFARPNHCPMPSKRTRSAQPKGTRSTASAHETERHFSCRTPTRQRRKPRRRFLSDAQGNFNPESIAASLWSLARGTAIPAGILAPSAPLQNERLRPQAIAPAYPVGPSGSGHDGRYSNVHPGSTA